LRRSWMAGRLVHLLVGWLVGWLIGSLVGWLVGWFVGSLVSCLIGSLVCWLVGWMAGLVLLAFAVRVQPFHYVVICDMKCRQTAVEPSQRAVVDNMRHSLYCATTAGGIGSLAPLD
jgi:predicted lysophospholipase L1 biosynthesis ABC-type transport system permease subunit